MAEALLWGVPASSSLLVGGLLALRVSIPTGVLGVDVIVILLLGTDRPGNVHATLAT